MVYPCSVCHIIIVIIIVFCVPFHELMVGRLRLTPSNSVGLNHHHDVVPVDYNPLRWSLPSSFSVTPWAPAFDFTCTPSSLYPVFVHLSHHMSEPAQSVPPHTVRDVVKACYFPQFLVRLPFAEVLPTHPQHGASS